MSFLKMQLKRIGAELVGALVDAGFDKASELATQARERRQPPPGADSSDPLQKAVGELKPGVLMSRHKCPDCGCFAFFKRGRGDIVRFWCRREECGWEQYLDRDLASNREGVPL
jgi:predicted RNA-binding Zn ribbon-like protein